MRRLSLMLAATTALTALPALALAGEYALVIDEQVVNITGKPLKKITVNGTIPGPALRFKEGEEVTVRVTNRLKENTSVHWHGLILPPEQDGVPGFNGFPGIKPGETYTYRFPIQQSGTYWYHAHSATQEQSGHYGPLIIEPAAQPVVRADREYTVLLSDFTEEDPEEIISNLKVDPGFYNFSKRTVPDFFRDARKFGLRAAWRDRRAWGRMRMDPTDIADVANYHFLVNGKPAAKNETFLFRPGERVKLRFINAAAMTFFDVRIPGLKMTVVAADGRAVEPVPVDEFRFAVSETYDVIVEPTTEQAFTVFAESIDRTGYARATLAPREGMTAPIPAMRPRALLTMAEMGHNMSQMGGGMDHAAMGHGSAPASASVDHAAMGHGSRPAQAAPQAAVDHAAMGHGPAPAQADAAPAPPVDHAAMGHSAPPAQAAQPSAIGMEHSAMDHAAMGHGPAPAQPSQTKAAVQPAMDHSAMGHGPAVAQGSPTAAQPEGQARADHAAMGHGTAPVQPVQPAGAAADHSAMGHGPAAGQASAPAASSHAGMDHSPTDHAQGRTAFPQVDYGMGKAVDMAGMDHGSGGEGGMDMFALAPEGEFDGSGRVFGWASGAPYGSKVLSYADLRSQTPQQDLRPAEREVVVRLSGNMERYIWTLNGAKFGEAEPIQLRYGERVKLTFVNETMMAHPMHLHGMFMQLDNGQPADRVPDKSVVSVAPGKTYSVLITADQAGEWAFHCHLLYHMEAGMMQKVVVARLDGAAPAPASTPAPARPNPHAGHGGGS